MINNTVLLLNAYYEALYEFLDSSRVVLIEKIEDYLAEELKNLSAPNFDAEKHAAYLDAALAFLDERMESYNPIGLQYTFGSASTRFAHQLELQLNFYDSTEEFDRLKQAAAQRAFPNMTDTELKTLAGRLIAELGAFPDTSIINAYHAAPSLNKLPDYIVASAIENSIKTINQ